MQKVAAIILGHHSAVRWHAARENNPNHRSQAPNTRSKHHLREIRLQVRWPLRWFTGWLKCWFGGNYSIQAVIELKSPSPPEAIAKNHLDKHFQRLSNSSRKEQSPQHCSLLLVFPGYKQFRCECISRVPGRTITIEATSLSEARIRFVCKNAGQRRSIRKALVSPIAHTDHGLLTSMERWSRIISRSCFP